MKIAVVGAGISGLTAACVLSRRHDVTVFEAADRIGGHTHTVTVRENGQSLAIDTGFIVFNEQNYPNLCRLFDQFDVGSRESNMSFSVHREDSALEYNGSSVNTLLSQRRNAVSPRFWSMLADILRFHRVAQKAIDDGLDDYTTVETFARATKFGDAFVENYLLPLGASLWSCNAKRFRQFPMRFVIEFLQNHKMLQVNGRPQWKTVVGGSEKYLKRITQEFRDRIQLNSVVQSVIRSGVRVDITTRKGDTHTFDEVILATHADQSLTVMNEKDEQETAILTHFPYQPNDVVLHTDTNLMPQNRRAWAGWNYRIPAVTTNAVTVTYNMNILQGLDSERTYCVSLNQSNRVQSHKILKRIRYSHPLFIPGRSEAQALHSEMIRRRGVSYCGAYWGYGFHEDGVVSALRVCESFGMGLDS